MPAQFNHASHHNKHSQHQRTMGRRKRKGPSKETLRRHRRIAEGCPFYEASRQREKAARKARRLARKEAEEAWERHRSEVGGHWVLPHFKYQWLVSKYDQLYPTFLQASMEEVQSAQQPRDEQLEMVDLTCDDAEMVDASLREDSEMSEAEDDNSCDDEHRYNVDDIGGALKEVLLDLGDFSLGRTSSVPDAAVSSNMGAHVLTSGSADDVPISGISDVGAPPLRRTSPSPDVATSSDIGRNVLTSGSADVGGISSGGLTPDAVTSSDMGAKIVSTSTKPVGEGGEGGTFKEGRVLKGEGEVAHLYENGCIDLTNSDDDSISSEGGGMKSAASPSTVIPDVVQGFSSEVLDEARSCWAQKKVLTEEEVQTVGKYFKTRGRKSKVLIKGVRGDTIYQESFKRLLPRKWLNDEIINYFYQLMDMEDSRLCVGIPGRKRSLFFSTYFVQRLFDSKSDNRKLRGRYNFKNVEGWVNRLIKTAPGGDLLNFKRIFIPVHLSVHWVCSVIDIEEKEIMWYDSLGGVDEEKAKLLLSFLRDACGNDGRVVESEWKIHLRDHRVKIPRQYNGKRGTLICCSFPILCQFDPSCYSSFTINAGYDCGVFTCMFARFISLDLELDFCQGDINLFRKRIALEIIESNTLSR